MLHRQDRQGFGNINLEIDDTNRNYIDVEYYDRKGIITQLDKVNNKYNSLKIYSKNISNDIFYNNDTQMNFSNDSTFFEKNYTISFKKKILLKYILQCH